MSDRSGGALGDRFLIFLHIAKTGGTTVERGIKALFGSRLERISAGSVQLGSVGPPPEGWSRLQAISGDFTYKAARRGVAPLVPKTPIFLSVIRDPVQRLRSLYSYVRMRHARPEERELLLGVPDDDDVNVVVRRWLAEPRSQPMLRSHQCRFLCGQASAQAAADAIEANYLAVVTTPGIDSLMQAMASAVLCRDLERMHLRNSHSAKISIDPELASQLREGSADQELFEWVSANESRLIERARIALGALVERPGGELRDCASG